MFAGVKAAKFWFGTFLFSRSVSLKLTAEQRKCCREILANPALFELAFDAVRDAYESYASAARSAGNPVIDILDWFIAHGSDLLKIVLEWWQAFQ